MSNTPRQPIQVNLDDCDEPVDVIDALFLERFISGTEPISLSLELQRVRAEADLLPAGVSPSRRAETSYCVATLSRREGWTLRVVRRHDGSAKLSVTARSPELATRVLDDASKDASDPSPPPDDKRAAIGFWQLDPRYGPSRVERTLAVDPWQEISRNYTAAAAKALGRLMSLTPDDIVGRLVVLFGPPGTGKTTALRALTDAWRPWCQVDYVLDPDRLFESPTYMLRVGLGEQTPDGDDEHSSGRTFRMLLLEDCDHLIGGEVGPELGRLLNLSDGILGQGLNLLLAITTNKPRSWLHPGLTRPGRCLAQVEVGRLTASEARSWIGRPVRIGADGIALADLVALESGGDEAMESEPRAIHTGMYL
jgi:hypothetical protein